MKCGERFETSDDPGDTVMRLDVAVMPPLALTFDGRTTWTYWCSAFCAAFGRCVEGRQLTIQEARP